MIMIIRGSYRSTFTSQRKLMIISIFKQRQEIYPFVTLDISWLKKSETKTDTLKPRKRQI